MEATITIEIELPVSFNFTPGYQGTLLELGCEDQINDIKFNHDAAISAIETALEDYDIDDILMQKAEEARLEWEADRAEFFLENRRVV
jgi:hypothetical protein